MVERTTPGRYISLSVAFLALVFPFSVMAIIMSCITTLDGEFLSHYVALSLNLT